MQCGEMKILCVLAIALVGVAVGEDYMDDILPDPSWAALVENSSRGQLLRVNDANTTCSAVYSCQDCNTARICKPTSNGDYQLVQTVPCSGSRPFCDPNSGSCVAEEPDNCGDKDNFICMGNGKFPDTNCTRFHTCLDYQSLTFECRIAGESYNARTQVCEASSPCGTFDCAGSEGSKVPHSEYTGYFAFCRNENGPLVVDSCPGNYELNVTSQLCEPVCHYDGIQADVTDCHYYFKCTKMVIRRDISYMQRDRLRCPDGQFYSSTDFLCVDESKVEACQK